MGMPEEGAPDIQIHPNFPTVFLTKGGGLKTGDPEKFWRSRDL